VHDSSFHQQYFGLPTETLQFWTLRRCCSSIDQTVLPQSNHCFVFNKANCQQLIMSPNPILLTGLGAVAAVFLATWGSSYASVASGIYAMHSTGIASFVPIIISGVLSIYGLIIAYVLSQKMSAESEMSANDGYKHLCAGLAVGLACLMSGYGMASVVFQILYDDENGPEDESHSAADVVQPLIGSIGNPSQHRRRRRLRGHIPSPSLRFLAVLVFLEAMGLYGALIASVIISI
jgi:ATP synthase proteolipid subunit